MIGNLIAFLVATFLVEPLQSKLAGAWVGTTSPVAVLTDAEPSCAPALAAARPFLAGS